MENNIYPKYPFYIVSKGRWENRPTANTLQRLNIPFFMVVEKNEVLEYSKYISKDKILILPQRYLDEYNTFWERAKDNKVGPGAARNFCWDHSISLGFKRHWVLDDNIFSIWRLNKNTHIKVESPAVLKCMEDFVDRYENVAIAGPENIAFVFKINKIPPIRLNTRIYSFLLIKNDIPYRWRGRYNEDTDICIRVLKDGWCNILFWAFTMDKASTQTMKGGNTDEFYAAEGTLPKSKILEDMHPDVAKVVWKFNRWHHEINYKPFQKNKLIKKQNLNISKGIDNYGMELMNIENKSLVGVRDEVEWVT